MPRATLSGTSTDAGSAAALYAKIKWHIGPLLILMYVVAFLDRVNISFASISMNRDLQITDSLFGFGAGIFFVGYLIFGVPSNILLNRFGARRWIAIIMLVWGILSTSMAFLQGARMYIVFRFLLGLAEAGFFPGIILYLTRWLPASARAGLMAMFVVAIPLSNVIGAPLSNWILSFDGRSGLHGWQWLFLLEGLPAILLGLLVPFLLAERPHDVEWLTREEKWSVTRALEEDRASASHENVAWPTLLTNGTLLGFAFQYFVLMVGLYALGFWVPKILVQRGVAAVSLGWLTALPFAVGAVCMLWCGSHSDRSGERKWHLFTSFACAAAGFGIVAAHTPRSVTITGLALAAAGVFSAMPIFWTALTQSIEPGLAAFAIAGVNSVGNIGGFVGPIVVGRLLQTTGSYTYGLLFTSSCLLLGALVLSCTPANRPQKQNVAGAQ